jgi:hypothetical protein
MGRGDSTLEEPHAQSGLRSGKLARIVPEAVPDCSDIGYFSFISRRYGCLPASVFSITYQCSRPA